MKKILLLLFSVALIFTMLACAGNDKNKDSNPSKTPDQQMTETPENGEEIPADDDRTEDLVKDSFAVVFKDYDDRVIKTETVPKGGKASPPVGMKREGYKFIKWDKAFDNVQEDLTVVAVYEEIKGPTLIVDTVYAKGRDVVVEVHVQKDPGVLSLLLNTIYIENAMELKKIESGQAMKGYTFTGPKNLGNGCNAAWHNIDVPDHITDGEVMRLHFRLKKNVAPGAYKISVSCQNGAFDSNYKEVKFDTIHGYVIVESEEITK